SRRQGGSRNSGDRVRIRHLPVRIRTTVTWHGRLSILLVGGNMTSVHMHRRSLVALLVAVLSAPAARAQTPAPLIDRELFFGDPEISGAQISPDGRFIAFIKPFKNTRNIWVKKTGDPFTAAKLITADPKRPIPQFFWSRDAKYILFVQDQARR